MDLNDFFRLLTMSGAKRDDSGNFQVGPAEMANFKMFSEQEQQRDQFFRNDQFTQNTDWLNKF